MAPTGPPGVNLGGDVVKAVLPTQPLLVPVAVRVETRGENGVDWLEPVAVTAAGSHGGTVHRAVKVLGQDAEALKEEKRMGGIKEK